LPYLNAVIPGILENPFLLAVIAIVFSLLLVSRFELFALKFKNFDWSDNKLRYAFLLLALILLATLRLAALPLVIILYIGLSLGASVLSRAGK
jgi:CDP-diacylglycerol--serine O-phosphatidyltransferase